MCVVWQGKGGKGADVALVGQFERVGGRLWQVERRVIRLDEADLQARAFVLYAPGESELFGVVDAEFL